MGKWLAILVGGVICGDAIVGWTLVKSHIIVMPVTNTLAIGTMTVQEVGTPTIHLVTIGGITVKRVTTNNTTNWCISTPLRLQNGTRIGAFQSCLYRL